MSPNEIAQKYRLNGLFLRPITIDDTDLILSWRNHPSVRENFIYRKTISKEEHENWFVNKIQKGLVIQFIIVDEKNNDPLGCVYLKNIDYKNKKAEEGIFLSPEYPKRKGIGKSAATLIVKYAFSELKLHKVTARVLSYNDASLKLHESIGFSKEALLKDELFLNGKFEDLIFFGILENEFKGCDC